MDTCRRLHIKLLKSHPKVNGASSTLCHVPYNKNIMKALTSYIFFQGTSKDTWTWLWYNEWGKKLGCKEIPHVI